MVSASRVKGDELLLAADGEGWVSKKALLALMAEWVTPGVAMRAYANKRKSSKRHYVTDTLLAGQMLVAQQRMFTAVRTGHWQVSDCGTMVRHKSFATT